LKQLLQSLTGRELAEISLLGPNQSPFRGSFAFEEEDALLFYGRDKETDQLVKKLAQDRFLPVRLVIGDDHPIFRDGLRRLLEAEANFKVVGEASDGAEAVTLVRQLKPDILLLDLATPKHSGLEALRDLSVPGNASPVRVILLVAAVEMSQIAEALRLGARGIVLKDPATQFLFKAIQAVMAGQCWVAQEIVLDLVNYLRMQQSSDDEARENKFRLTPRELEIVSAVAAGYSNPEIADHIGLSQHTVRTTCFEFSTKWAFLRVRSSHY
jgi:two-component system, NarL family, nitrate/nitrite response regulator NarL